MVHHLSRAFTAQTKETTVKSDKNTVKLQVERSDYGNREFVFGADVKYETDDFIVVKYSANGLMRPGTPRCPILYAKTDGGLRKLVDYQDIIVDGQVHTVIVTCERFSAQGFQLSYFTKTLSADFTLYEIYFCKESELPEMLSDFETKTSHPMTPINLEKYFNHQYTRELPDVILEGGRFFSKESINFKNIPFKISPKGNHVIYPDPSPKENEDIISNYGVKAKRRLCRPISRDSVFEIKIDRCVTEIYFIMTANGLMRQRWGFGDADSTILGSCRGEILMPLRITDIEFFMVEICYEDGHNDKAFPLNITKGRHIVGSETDIYAVPADGSKVKSIIIHNKKLETDFSVVAVTVNESKNRLYPQMLIQETPKSAIANVPKQKEIAINGEILTIKNDALSMEIDTCKGLKLLHFDNAYMKDFKFIPCPMLRIRDTDGEFNEFEPLEREISRNKATLTYTFRNLFLSVDINLTGDDNVEFNLSVKNMGENTEQVSILFPFFEGGKFSNKNDTRYFFPKCQNIDSDEYVNLYEESSPTFPMQFFDLYGRNPNGGLAFNTYERDLVVRKYGLTKNETGITAYIEYPFMYGDISAGDTFTCSSTTLTCHRGDWKKAFDIYKKWLGTWYKPYKSQNKAWYRHNFWLLAEIPDFFETNEFIAMPPWYDEKNKRMKFRDILDEHKSVTGCYPDILHMWGWTYDKSIGHMKWGNFGEEDYETFGGKEAFKEALHDIKDHMGIDVSLYLHPTLLSPGYSKAERFFDKCRAEKEDGSFIGRLAFRMCHANKEWRDEALSFYPKIYEDLKIPILYVDEFSLRIENRCYGKEHGHHVPSNLLQTDREFISELRDTVPEEVVLYGEYTAVDVNAKYIDCCISYQIVDTVMTMIETNDWRYDNGDDTYSRVLTDVYRFAFPKIVQLNLPMAMRKLSWHPQKFIFFNGEAIYDSFWDNEESAGLDFTVKAYRLKKKYAHCFASDHPETMIATPSEAICANKFPGEQETVYTIYNRAYITYRGPVLEVPHKDGQKYYDAWNDKTIQPSIENGRALISLEIDAQQIGCVVVGNEFK